MPRITLRWFWLATFVAITVAFAASAVVTLARAGDHAPATSSAETHDAFCLYQGRTDTPEIGPLPCDTSRPYMIGHGNFGATIPPDAAEPDASVSASPATPDVSSDHAEPGVEAP